MVVKVIYGSKQRIFLCDNIDSDENEDRTVVKLLGPDDDAPPLHTVTLNKDGQHLYVMLDVNDGKKNTIQSFHWPPRRATVTANDRLNSNDSNFREESNV